jgi:hypothetical protein
MLKLRVERGAAPAAPSLDAPGVEKWLDNDGSLAAYGGSLGGRHWMVLPYVGSFWFSGNGNVHAFPNEAVGGDVVEDSFRRIVLPMALQATGVEVLHASAVAGANGVVALCAVSETGKTTIAFGLSQRGFSLWADDAVAVRVSADGVDAVPLPFAMRLRPASAEFFGISPDDVEPPSTPTPGSLATICVLERLSDGDGGPVVIDRLGSAEAFPAVLAHAYSFSLADDERKRAMVQEYLEVVARVPVLRVRVRAGLERLPEILDEIEAAVA